MGGLLSARVLADAYQRVTVLDRDLLPERAADRQGVPQGQHAHALLARGAQILEKLFPGLLADLAAAGVPVLTSPRELWFSARGHLLCLDGGAEGEGEDAGYLPSRPFLESQVRARVAALGNVSVRDRCAVAGLVTTPARDQVTGVRVRPAGTEEDEEITADLVADATGRGGRTPAWLTELGYDPPAEEQVRVDVKYASRHLRLPPRRARRAEADPDRHRARPADRAGPVRPGRRPLDPDPGRLRRSSPPSGPGRIPGLRAQHRPVPRVRRDRRRQPTRRHPRTPVPGQPAAPV
jgi:hypothetical protein